MRNFDITSSKRDTQKQKLVRHKNPIPTSTSRNNIVQIAKSGYQRVITRDKANERYTSTIINQRLKKRNELHRNYD